MGPPSGRADVLFLPHSTCRVAAVCQADGARSPAPGPQTRPATAHSASHPARPPRHARPWARAGVGPPLGPVSHEQAFRGGTTHVRGAAVLEPHDSLPPPTPAPASLSQIRWLSLWISVLSRLGFVSTPRPLCREELGCSAPPRHTSHLTAAGSAVKSGDVPPYCTSPDNRRCLETVPGN